MGRPRQIFLYEHVTGGGLLGAATEDLQALQAEGGAMWGAVLRDLGRIDAVRVVTMVDGRFDVPCPSGMGMRVHRVNSVEEWEQRFDELARDADDVLLIAPETGGVLTRLTERVERLGARLLSPSSTFCAWGADKTAVATTMAQAGVPMPHGVRLAATDPWPSEFPAPAVLKPNDGCGSDRVRRLDDCSTDARYGAETVWRLEKFAPGRAASVACLCGPTGFVILPPCLQRLSDDGEFRYLGGLRLVDEASAVRLAERVCAALPPVVGYIGLDLVLGPADDGSDDVLIEVNPRVTTSYVGLAQMQQGNLAEGIIRMCDGRGFEPRWNAELVSFTASGELRSDRTEPDGLQGSVIALDIGGANLKASDGGGYSRAAYFPLWKSPERLADAVDTLFADAPPCSTWVVTMTGELADCFRTKREGVAAILDAVEVAAARCAARPRVLVYLTDGTFVSPEVARLGPLQAAASNWHALAAFVARRFRDSSGLLIDVGSTTCDLIPFADGAPTATGHTDPDRLASGELVYTGVVRSPVCALVRSLPWRGGMCGTAQELFATTLDAYLVLGRLPEDLENCNTADGRPATIEFARDRLARCICADRESFDLADARAAAVAIEAAQWDLMSDAWSRVVARGAVPEVVVVGGQGEFLAKALLNRVGFVGRVVSLSAEFGDEASRAGPAYALARLAMEGTILCSS
ncbi:MAG: hypothetical protein C0483_16765 [Pirellula sp.]|nr:hypothetical protein [Pirellula sp.]